MPDRIENRNTIEKTGKYNRLILGNPDISGYIDAPHGTPIPEDKIAEKVNTGRFLTSAGTLANPASNVIYASKALRRLLFGVKSWRDIPQQGQVQINGVSFYVKQSRRDAAGKRQIAFVRANHKDAIVAFIKTKSLCDSHTDEIAEAASDFGVTVMITDINRHIGDINRGSRFVPGLGQPGASVQQEAIEEYRSFKKEALEHTGNMDNTGHANKPFLHIALHGMADQNGEIEIGTRNGATCDNETTQWFIGKLKAKFAERNIKINGRVPKIGLNNARYQGDITKTEGPKAHGANFKTVQLELCKTLRTEFPGEISQILAEILQEFTAEISRINPDHGNAVSETAHDINEQVSESTEIGHILKVRSVKRGDVGKAVISRELAIKLKAKAGAFMTLTNSKKRCLELVEVVVRDYVEAGEIALDQNARNELNVNIGDDQKIEFTIK